MTTTGTTASTPSLAFNLTAIASLVALVAIALAYGIDAANRRTDSASVDEPVLVRTLGGKDLEIPESWFRYAEQKIEGFARQVDLTLTLPLGAAGGPAEIGVTLLPSSRVRPSASLLDGVYLHQFAGDEPAGPAGLMGKALSGAEGTAGETVWFDPIASDPFVAKCAAPVAPEVPSRCLRSVRLAPGLAAIYVFDAPVLENWRLFDARMRETLSRIGI